MAQNQSELINLQDKLSQRDLNTILVQNNEKGPKSYNTTLSLDKKP